MAEFDEETVQEETAGQPAEGTEQETPAEEPQEEPEGDSAADSGESVQVRKLRDEAASYRVRAKEAEAQIAALQQEIFSLRVAADGRLADPADLPYADGLADADGVTAAISALLESKPHYAARKPAALPEQSVSQEEPAGPTFAELLRTL